MQSHHRMRYQDEYEQEDYDEYEKDASEEEQEMEEEDEEKEELTSEEQQDFLRLREELKEKFRQKLKNEIAGSFVHRSQSQDQERTTANDDFGSFFGPSKPVIASRVLEERHSIRETQHITSRIPNVSSSHAKDTAYKSSEKKALVHKQQPKIVNEVKKRAQTLRDMRDYSFLLSDDADFSNVKEEQRLSSASNSGHKALPSKASDTSKPVKKVMKDPYLKSNPSSAVSHSSAQKSHYDQKRPSQSLNNMKSMPNKPSISSKSQTSKKIPPRDSHEDRLKKRPMRGRLDNDDDEDAIEIIRKMFGYNPNKYWGVDDDVSDMEADFREIQKEERRCAKIAKKEDDEQLRLIEEEEKRERMRKKQKLKR